MIQAHATQGDPVESEVERVRFGDAVTIEIEEGGAIKARRTTWRLTHQTDRSRAWLGPETALAQGLMGSAVGDEVLIHPSGGDSFLVTVVAIKRNP